MSTEEIAHQENKYRGVWRDQTPENVQFDNGETFAREQFQRAQAKAEQRADTERREKEIRLQFEARYGKRPEIDRENAR
jgi:hypothetical protein